MARNDVEKTRAEIRLLGLREARERSQLVPTDWAQKMVDETLVVARARLLAVADEFSGELRKLLHEMIAEALAPTEGAAPPERKHAHRPKRMAPPIEAKDRPRGPRGRAPE